MAPGKLHNSTVRIPVCCGLTPKGLDLQRPSVRQEKESAKFGALPLSGLQFDRF